MEKSKIVARLLENKSITADEAVVLLKEINSVFRDITRYEPVNRSGCKNGPVCFCTGSCNNSGGGDISNKLNTSFTGGSSDSI